MLKRFLLICGATGTLACFADTVYLTNGGTLEGRTRVENGRLIVEQPAGVVMVDLSRVEHIEKRRTELDDYDDMVAKLKNKTDAKASEWGEVAQFCTDHRLGDRAQNAWRQALKLDPDNAAARKALGFVKINERWLTEDEANAARGLVKHNGAWVTPEAKSDLVKLAAETEAARAKTETEKAKAEVERLKQERIDKELELIEAEQARAREYDPCYHGIVSVYTPPVLVHTDAQPQNPAKPLETTFAPLSTTTADGSTVRVGPGGALIVTPGK